MSEAVSLNGYLYAAIFVFFIICRILWYVGSYLSAKADLLEEQRLAVKRGDHA